ncbi:MAG: hypothetical protein [Caudoviricetes sp.]|nr:MAG: hypothetical protein [Caudoviricetes sp.]
MNVNQIRRFFKRNGLKIHVRANNDGIVQVYNDAFTVYLEDDNYWFDSSETTYHDNQCPTVLYDMIVHGFELSLIEQ